jgi:hypothetical protein
MRLDGLPITTDLSRSFPAPGSCRALELGHLAMNPDRVLWSDSRTRKQPIWTRNTRPRRCAPSAERQSPLLFRLGNTANCQWKTRVDHFLAAAIHEARLGLAEGGIPIGSVAAPARLLAVDTTVVSRKVAPSCTEKWIVSKTPVGYPGRRKRAGSLTELREDCQPSRGQQSLLYCISAINELAHVCILGVLRCAAISRL